MAKLNAYRIIRDTDIGSMDEAEMRYNKMIAELNTLYHNDAKIIPHLFAAYFAKVYVNYHWAEIMNSYELDLSDLHRFYEEKLSCFLDTVTYDLPYLFTSLKADVSRLIKDYAINAIQVFHHDFLPDDHEEFQPFSYGSGDKRVYFSAYKHVVLGTKKYLSEAFKATGDGDE